MSNLIRPLNRCLSALKQTNGAFSVMQRRLESTKVPVAGSVNKPLEKASTEVGVDPKESCELSKKLFTSLTIVFI